LVGNEENGYPLPDPNKTIINATNEPSDTHKKFLKLEIMEEITEKFMEKIPTRCTQEISKHQK
jgi:hypothetical protein